MQVERETLRANIDGAFGAVPVPTNMTEMLAAPYRTSDDAYELATALFGRAWVDVPVRELFRHREMLFALAPAAYCAYLPAYLVACLTADDPLDEHGADLREYLIDSLIAAPDASADRQATTAARLAALDAAQRAAATAVVRYLESRWRVRRADEALRSLAG